MKRELAMRFLRDLPIKRKLTFITMLTSCLALLLACIGFTTYEQVTFRRTMARDLSVLTDLYDDNVASGLAFSDPKSIEQTLKSLDARPQIVMAAVYDKSGSVIAAYQRSNLQASFPIPAAQATGTRFEKNRLDAFRNIILAGEMIGTIYIASDLTELRARFWRYGVIVGLVLGVSSFAAFLLARKLQRVISEPVGHLAQIAHTVALNKDYSVRAVKQSGDELGRLVDGFNEMLARIQESNAALQDAHDTLEKRVEERTQELEMEVAERKQAAQALRASEERIRLIVDTALDAVISCDASGSIIEWNAQAERTFGWSRAEAVGRNLTETIIPPKYREAHERGMKRFLATGEGPVLNKRIEFTALQKDGREFPVELAISPVRIGGTFLFSAFLRDITERKEAEQKLQAAHRQLLDASRQAGMAEVATGVLHNVGNVLNSVNVTTTLISDQLKKSPVLDLERVVALFREHEPELGAFFTQHPKGQKVLAFLAQLAERLKQENLDHREEMESLRKNVEHIKDIVSMQQSYAKVSGVHELVNLTDLLEDSLRMNAGALERHRVHFSRDYAEVPPINTDKHKVLQILVNLVRNAKYACAESPRNDKQLTIRLTNGDGSVKIAITDNGVGIPRENLTRIFNHGFTTRKDGHGFGLHSGALAAKELGGSLTCHSDGPGHGAVFILELPCRTTPEVKTN